MEFLAEDMGRCALLRVTDKEVAFCRVTPQRVDNVDIAIVGKAKVVVFHGIASTDDAGVADAIRDAWVLVVNGIVRDELVAAAHPYVTIVKGGADAASYEQFSRGWNVEDAATGAYTHKGVVTVGKDERVEVLFGESRENPIGLLSVKCTKG